MAHIKIPAEVTYASTTVGATPSTGPFHVDFSLFAKADLRVRVGETELSQAQFTFAGTAVDGGFDGGDISLVSPVSNTTVLIWRDVVPERTSDFSPATYVRVGDLDTLADRLTAMVADVRRDVASALKLGVGEVYPMLPGPADRANGLFGFDALGAADFKQIGVDVQAYAANLAALAGLAGVADRMPYFTGPGALSLATLSPFARTLIDDADAPTMRGTLGLAAVYQPLDATLTALAGLSTGANKLIYATGSDAFATTDLTSFGRSLIDDADAATARFTLGLTDGSDKLLASLLPNVAITDTFVVSSDSAMLALNAQRGDVCVRPDLSKSFILINDTPGVLGNWQELISPSSFAAVSSFNGRSGGVTLTSGDVTAALTYTPANKAGDTFTGLLVTTASAAGGAGFRMPHGAAPSAPVNGDFWTATTGVFARINGATKQLATTDSNITGSAASLTTARNFSITGGATAPAIAFDGTGGVALNLTLDAPSVRSVALPPGAVSAFALNAAPSGWLECDGSAVSRSTYAALFAAIGVSFGAGDGSTTFNLPDLRGEFVRGLDHGRGVDAGRALGSAQADSIKTITFQSSRSSSLRGDSSALDSFSGNPATGALINITPAGVAETRPRNVALLYAIKT